MSKEIEKFLVEYLRNKEEEIKERGAIPVFRELLDEIEKKFDVYLVYVDSVGNLYLKVENFEKSIIDTFGKIVKTGLDAYENMISWSLGVKHIVQVGDFNNAITAFRMEDVIKVIAERISEYEEVYEKEVMYIIKRK
jgi:hypothetical protein